MREISPFRIEFLIDLIVDLGKENLVALGRKLPEPLHVIVVIDGDFCPEWPQLGKGIITECFVSLHEF